ncbi:hypothetical protein [Streptomyces sp. NPDC093589]|uniref:hypothetical protein n=1 Tax=Streptomyces sp. NPDC093589 TaxID=3366043 RepID=UPI003820C980
MSKNTLESYLQLSQQRDRRADPEEGTWANLAGLLSEEAPASAAERGSWPSRQFHDGQMHAEEAQRPQEEPQELFTEACLHGLKARMCDDVDSLDSYLPPHVAELARKVAGVLEEPLPAAV